MWRNLIQWLKRLLGLPGPGAVEGHPPLDTDRGAREHIEKLMEADSRHAGR